MGHYWVRVIILWDSCATNNSSKAYTRLLSLYRDLAEKEREADTCINTAVKDCQAVIKERVEIRKKNIMDALRKSWDTTVCKAGVNSFPTLTAKVFSINLMCLLN